MLWVAFKTGKMDQDLQMLKELVCLQVKESV